MQVSFSILRANGEAGKIYTAEGAAVAFGRSEECHVQLDDGYVSNRHAEIQLVDGRFYLQDLKSTNGTWIRENRVDGRIAIHDNEVVEFGKGGPKIRVVSLRTNVPATALESIRQGKVERAAQSVEYAGSGRAEKRSPGGWILIGLIAGASILALATSIFLARPFTHSTNDVVQPDGQPVREVKTPNDLQDVATVGALTNDSSLVSEPIPVDYARIAERVQDQAVWIGLKVKSDDQTLVYPLCNGWQCSASQVITSGSAVADLEIARESSAIVVYSHLLPDSDPFIEVKQMKIHPGFVASEPESSASKENNLGLLELSRPLPNTQLSDQASSVEWRNALSSDSVEKLIQCGYSIALKPEPISAVSMPAYSWTQIRTGEAIPGSSVKSLPLIRVSIEKAQETRSGHFVVSASGNIFGTLLHIDEANALLIPIDRIPDLLSPAVSHAR